MTQQDASTPASRVILNGSSGLQAETQAQERAQEEAELFGPEVPSQLSEPWALTTPALAKIDEDASWLLSGTAGVLTETLGLPAALCTHTASARVRFELKMLWLT